MKPPLIFLFVAGSIFSSTDSLQKAVKDNACWIGDCQGDRLYLQTDRIILEKSSMYVLDSLQRKIPLKELFADSQGLYTTIESLGEQMATVYPIVWCRTCQAYRTVDISGRCVVCGNSP